jgi:predicted Zn-dependent peptidase
VPEIDAYHKARYTSASVVVAAAGNLEHERIVELAKLHVSPPSGEIADVTGGRPEANGARLAFQQKDTEQYHICLGAPGIERSDERRFALGVLDTVFGGSTSSRLFREVREKRGLAYSVGSYTQQYADGGMVALYVGTREDNVTEACEVIGAELARLHTDGIAEDELERAKEHVKGRMVLSNESTAARMSRLGRALLFDMPILSLDEMLARVDAVTRDDVFELARELYAPNSLAAAAIAPDESKFRAALAPVNEGLAAV